MPLYACFIDIYAYLVIRFSHKPSHKGCVVGIRVRHGSHLVEQFGTWYCHVQVPRDVREVIRKDDGTPRGAWKVCLHTRDKREAEIRKLSVLEKCENEIEMARKIKRGEGFKFAEWKDNLSKTYVESGEGGIAAIAVAQKLKSLGGRPEDPETQKVFGEVTKRISSTAEYIRAFLQDREYADDVDAQPVLMDWSKRFPYFEEISTDTLREWVLDMMQGRKGYTRQIARATAAKKVTYVKQYWEWCFASNHTRARNLAVHQEILPKAQSTKSLRKTENTSYRPYSIEQCWRLHQGAVEDGYRHLDDLILLAMYTGCRIGELCDLRVENVTDEYIKVTDAKTYSGDREIPIHGEIQQTVERLKQTSTDGFMFAELSDPNVFRKKGKRYKGISQKFGRLKSGMGFGSHYGFHSFRATFANRLENAGVNEVIAARLMGHRISTMTYGLYSGQADWHLIVEAMRKVTYPK